MPVQQIIVKNSSEIENFEWNTVPYMQGTRNGGSRAGSTSSQTSNSNSSGDICRICHCESDAQNPLLAPCYCSGKLWLSCTLVYCYIIEAGDFGINILHKQCQQTVYFLQFYLLWMQWSCCLFYTVIPWTFPLVCNVTLYFMTYYNCQYYNRYIFWTLFFIVFRKFEICSPKLSTAMVDSIGYEVLRALQISFYNAYKNQTIQWGILYCLLFIFYANYLLRLE